jgi:uncharacterized membrane protein
MSTTPLPGPQAGRTSALLAYGLFLLSIPSFAIFALIGVIVALAGRDGASPLARSHLDYQIRIWFTAFWWTVGLAILAVIGWITAVILIGFVLIWIADRRLDPIPVVYSGQPAGPARLIGRSAALITPVLRTCKSPRAVVF